jgi:hypothetical protein
LFLAWLTLRPWRKMRYVPPKCRTSTHILTFTALQLRRAYCLLLSLVNPTSDRFVCKPEGSNWPDTTEVLPFECLLLLLLLLLLLWRLLWSSGQSSWLQIQRSGFDSRRYKNFWDVVDLERGPLSFVSRIQELLERESSGSGLENREYGRRDPSRWLRDNPLFAKVGTNFANNLL